MSRHTDASALELHSYWDVSARFHVSSDGILRFSLIATKVYLRSMIASWSYIDLVRVAPTGIASLSRNKCPLGVASELQA